MSNMMNKHTTKKDPRNNVIKTILSPSKDKTRN